VPTDKKVSWFQWVLWLLVFIAELAFVVFGALLLDLIGKWGFGGERRENRQSNDLKAVAPPLSRNNPVKHRISSVGHPGSTRPFPRQLLKHTEVIGVQVPKVHDVEEGLKSVHHEHDGINASSPLRSRHFLLFPHK